MKSRFEVLKTPAERRSLALVGSSGPVVIALLLVAVTYLAPANQAPRQAVTGQLLAMEIGEPAESGMPVAAPAALAGHGAAVVAQRSASSAAERSYPSTYAGEPAAY